MTENSMLHINEEECRRFQSAAELAGRKWNAAILLAGARGARRFSEYQHLINGISDRLLSARMKELEGEGLVRREVQPTTPVTITYSLTKSGLQLISLLHPLVNWSREHTEELTRNVAPAAVANANASASS